MSRSSGIFLHPSSLPSPYGIGDFGPEAYAFVDFLYMSKQRIWGVLPLTIPDETGSPYASVSAHALNWLLVSPQELVRDGFLNEADVPAPKPVEPISFRHAYSVKWKLLRQAYTYFQTNRDEALIKDFHHFITIEQWWLDTYALFMAVKESHGGKPWPRWPKKIALRDTATMQQWQEHHLNQIRYYQFEQWVADRQWRKLKSYAQAKNISIYGDIPFFVTTDSVDVWSHQDQFLLDSRQRPQAVSGVPPDYFSRRGQIWNNPHYNWKVMQRDNFRWWLERFRRATYLYDMIRLDHFRGFDAVWHIPYGARTARHGSWQPVPGDALFAIVTKAYPQLSIIAEDLGMISESVTVLRERYHFPSMRVLQFAFNGFPNNFHRPEFFTDNIVVYTGTHDNTTSRGWITTEAKDNERSAALRELVASPETFAWKLIEYGMHSRAHLCLTPLPDLLNLGAEARLNKPGTKRGNWRWRFSKEALSAILSRRLAELTTTAKRGS
ncbi:MAG: 4-alpha-glucanotransferase [Candidatus Kerfeldbacteria bacterium]|nr:4-alpha-glucanotransferase [Candidatus Kerfeldbacteria bacterium]